MNLISEIQKQLAKNGIDGWLLYDFQGLNPIAKRLLNLKSALLTRRWYCWIPQAGEPKILCHQIEQASFDALKLRMVVFKNWKEMLQRLEDILTGAENVAMEYSAFCSIPYVAKVDSGTIETIRGLGKNIVSSADLIQFFQSRWSEEQLQMHLHTSDLLMQILFETFERIGSGLARGERLTEYTVQQDILQKFVAHRLTTSAPPIVAIGRNTANPHYEPSPVRAETVRRGDLLLIDLWAKLEQPASVYADYTWVAYLGDSVPGEIVEAWNIVRGARDAALDFVRSNYLQGMPIQGWQVDSVARTYIADRGFGEMFIHRTGHNIGEDDHGTGANLDNLETKDERQLIADTCFSIEPGIYLADFGVRSEVNVVLKASEIIVTGNPIQKEIHLIRAH